MKGFGGGGGVLLLRFLHDCESDLHDFFFFFFGIFTLFPTFVMTTLPPRRVFTIKSSNMV